MNGTCDWTCNCLALSKVLRAACLPCQHCQSYSVRGSRVLHACGKAYSLLSCTPYSLVILAARSSAAGLLKALASIADAGRSSTTGSSAGVSHPRHATLARAVQGLGGGVTPSLARLDKTGMCCCCKPCVVRGLRRGDTFKAYGTTKMWEIMVSMELNDR